MKQQIYLRAIAGLVVLLLFSATVHAGPIRIAFHDTTVAGGTQFDYPIYVDSSLTGLGVSAYQIECTFNTSIFSLIEVRSTGTMTSSWGVPEYNIISPGTLRIASAGSDTLSGTGKLVILRFAAGAFTYANAGNITFQSILFNQGSPTTTKKDGYVYVNAVPSITVSPETWLMTKGETKQFFISGGKSPYTWTSTNPSVASINSSGLLTSNSAGFTKVVCVDSSGSVDTSGTVEVRALSLSIHDTSRYQGQWLDLPIYTTNVNGLGITSGQFSITYNENLWTPDSFITTGTMLSGWAMAPMSTSPNKINVSFASASTLSGSGVLLYIRMKASIASYGGTSFGFTNPFFNESILSNSSSGYVTVTQLAPITVSPGGTQTLVAGDSIQFSASGGTGPYTWTVSDPSRASISSTGWLKGKNSGAVTVTAHDVLSSTGNSGTINIYDFRLSVPDTSVIPLSTVDIPLFVSTNTVGFSSVEMKVTYTTSSYVKLTDIISAGTLIAGWSVDMTPLAGAVTLAAAGVNTVTSGGTLLKLHFAIPDSTPRPSTIYITLSNVVFNQDVPLPLIDNGYFAIANSAQFNITPTSGTIQTDAVGKKDSMVFTVKNTGTATLTSTISIIGSGEFTLSTYNISVPSNDSVKLKAYYLPVNAGKDSCSIHFSTNDPFHSIVNIPFVGTVVTFPVLSINHTVIDFGNVVVGNFRDTIITLTNTGTDTLKITSIIANNGVFTARPGFINIPPGNSINDTLRFTPSSVTSYSARFIVTNNGLTSPDTIFINGAGVILIFPIIGLNTDSIDFGVVNVGAFKDTTVTITNSGTDTLKITSIVSDNGVFTSQTMTVHIPPGNSFEDSLRFAPSSITTYSARFIITSNAASSPDTIKVTGIGQNPLRVQTSAEVPKVFSLHQNYPNPFNPTTNIEFTLPISGYTSLIVYNMLGKEVATLVNGYIEAGKYHHITFDASKISSGIYFYQLKSGVLVETKKMSFLK